ncbi:MAG: DUF58 domain-containing protein [Nevskiales bacterium]
MRFWLIAKILLHPIRYAQERIDAWVMARVKRQPGPIPIPRQRIYIVPTRYGYVYALLLLLMLLGSMNYSNSMGFALTFLLAGLGLVAMHYTHANLVHLQVRAGRVPPVFAGETAHFEIYLDNLSLKPRQALKLAWPKQEALGLHSDLNAESDAALKLPLPAVRRGWLKSGVFSLSTEFPLSLFHAWTWLELDMSCLVFPKPAPVGGLPPPPARGSSGMLTGARAGQDEFTGLRDYQRGDAPKTIHWKSLPKLGTPMVKQFNETIEQEIWLDWDALPQQDFETRLSQLARWVLDAENGRRAYGLRMPDRRLAPARGETHLHECLKTLALFDTQP